MPANKEEWRENRTGMAENGAIRDGAVAGVQTGTGGG